jgi:hypothetical protein
MIDKKRLQIALSAWEARLAQAAQCPALACHGPGHQSKTHCEIAADEPHTVHATTYGRYNQFGMWKGYEAFDPLDDDDYLIAEYEAESLGRDVRRNLRRVDFIAQAYETAAP